MTFVPMNEEIFDAPSLRVIYVQWWNTVNVMSYR